MPSVAYLVNTKSGLSGRCEAAMESDDGFEAFGRAIKSDPIGVLLAKFRRDTFVDKLKKLPDVVAVIPSGSFTRGTQIGPVHDIDLIVVFDKSKRPDYGSGQQSAQGALEHLQKGLVEQLHPLTEEEGLLKDTKLGTHTVKCYTDVPRPFADLIPSAPPVDVMPAVREGFHLRVPERGTGWIRTDPEKFMREVAQRQHEWKYFTQTVGMLKAWAAHNNLHISNLAIEAMALKYFPRPRLFETLSRGDAIARFFEAAKADIGNPLSSKEWLRKIDPSFIELHGALSSAAKLSREAMKAERALEHGLRPGEKVSHPDNFWRELFGSKYPSSPQRRFLRVPAIEWWFGKSKVESSTTADFSDLGPTRRHSGPKRPGNLGPHGPGGHGPVPNFGPEGPDRGPEGPDRRPTGPGPRPYTPSDAPWGPRVRRQAGHTAPAPAEAGTSFWTGIFTASGSGAMSVPLTFG